MKTIVQRIIWLKQVEILQLFTIYLRYILGAAFVFAAFGMGKIISFSEMNVLGQGDPESPITQAFSSFINSDLYWSLIGWSQVIAGTLLVTQRFARFGIMMYIPIIANIFMLTYSYHFQGTDVITGLMLLAALYLAVWEGDILQYLLIDPSADNVIPRRPSPEKLHFWSYAGISMVVIIISTFRFIPVPFVFLLCFLVGMLALGIYIFRYRKRFHS